MADSTKEKRRFGDRRDGKLLRDLDGLHVIMPHIYPNRADNEAFILETVEMAPINAFIEKKNQELKDKVAKGELPESALEYPYKMFQIILSAVVKTVYLRPKMNRFIANRRMYQRNHVSVSFVVKKKFADNGAEALAFKKFGPETTVDDVHNLIVAEINACRSDDFEDNSTHFLDAFAKIPGWIIKFVFNIIRGLDQRDKLPASLIKTDPGYASVFLTNLGSIGLKSGYHHLSNWGTNSFFMILGEKKMKPFYDEKGNVTMKEVMDIGLTVDERIADGYYFSKTCKLFKKLLANPELLELRADEEIEY